MPTGLRRKRRSLAVVLLFCAVGVAPDEHPRRVAERATMRLEKADTLSDSAASICALWPKEAGDCAGLLRTPMSLTDVSRQALRGKLEEAVRRGRLTIAFLGDSITAGHDNYYNQSFVPLVEELLGAALKKAGVELVVHNLAVGNFGEYPFTSGCLRSRLGDELAESVNIVSWNWALFRDSQCEREQFVHDVYSLPSRPALLSLEDHTIPFANMGYRKSLMDTNVFCSRVKKSQSSRYWVAGKRPYYPSAWYLTEEYVTHADVQMFRDDCYMPPPEFGAKRRARHMADDGKLDSLSGALAKVQDEEHSRSYLARAHLRPAAISEHLGPAEAAWWAIRGLGVNFLWHPGPVTHLLIASQVSTLLLEETVQALRNLDGVVNRVRREGPRLRPSPGTLRNPPREHVTIRSECGLPTLLCASEVVPTLGKRLETMIIPAPSQPWVRMEDFLEADYRSFWKGHSPGLSSGKDAKFAYVGTKDSGPLEIRVHAQHAGVAALLCENRCGTSGCERHRGWASFGPKSSLVATFRGPLIEGERVNGSAAERQRVPYEDATVKKGSRRYSDEDIGRFRINPTQRAYTSDIDVEVDGVHLPIRVFGEMQAHLEKICRDCPKLRDACAVVATDLSEGFHSIKVTVNPRTYQDPDMHVAISQIMLV